MLSSAEAYLFRTAAIDGPSYANQGLYVYINPCTITVGGVTKTGTPAANFNVNSNTVYDVTYSASGYQTDTDDFYFDVGLPTCSGATCHLTTSHFDTHCTYSSTYDDWTCVVTDTTTSQWISFIYNKNDPTLGEVIRILNSMYPGECMPCETETKQCGQTDVGECSYGTQTRTCQSNYYWGSWGSCIGAVCPVTEICDGKDNDCDGLTDEGGVCWECTPGETETKQCGQTDVGECEYGTQTKTCNSQGQWGSWGSCVGAVYPVTEICDGKDNDCDGLIDEGGVCWECTTDNDCNHLDNDYCKCTQKVMHDEGICVNHECTTQTTQVQNCNDLDEYYCDNTNIMFDDYWCADAQCVIKSTDLFEECNNGLFCDGEETCEAAECVPGTAPDCDDTNECTTDSCNEDSDTCSNLDLPPGTECGDARDCSEDNCLDVYMYYYPVDGHDTCDGNGNCIEYSCESTENECDQNCGAQCDENSDCPDTSCGNDGCLGNDYYDYTDVSNTCEEDCACTENECGQPEISYNDPRCVECTTNDDCNDLDRDYCQCTTYVIHDEGRCINNECVAEPIQVENCNDLDEYYCDNTNIMYDDYWCADAQCVIKSTDLFEECDNGLFCDGQETCDAAECVPGTQIDCSNNNINGIETCNYCDSNPLTWDYRAEFTSTCDEGTDSCTDGDETVTHDCSVDNCDAQCDATHSCDDTECDNLDGCVGNNYYDYDDESNICETGCTCTNNQCDEPTITVNDPRCWECIPGEEDTISCYEGPEGTNGVGLCSQGTKTKTCDSEGQWNQYGECTGAVYPAEEICDELDNDCDGEIDEEEVCWECTPGETNTKQCGQTDVGECEYGTQTKTCDSQGQWGSWGLCIGAVYPATEICDGKDNDCDALVDEGGVCDTPLPDTNSVLGIIRFSILNDDYLRPGNSIMILATLENNGNTNLNDIQLTLVVPELDIRKRIGPFDLKKNQETTKLIILEIPYWAEPGYYDIRATASNGDVRRVKHREILIHN